MKVLQNTLYCLQKQLRQKYLRKGQFVAFLTVLFSLILIPKCLNFIIPYLRTHFSELIIYNLFVAGLNVLVTLGYNLFMLPIYKYKIPFFQQYRASSEAWPWESDPKGWAQRLKQSIPIVILNVGIVGPLVILTDSLIQTPTYSMKQEDTPAISTCLWQFGVFLLVQEALFYTVHRIMHSPKWYWMHKRHHEYNITVTLAAEYCHPIQHILANLVPTGLGYKLLNKVYPVHFYTICIWVFLRLLETCDGHCGYEWSWAQSALLPRSTGSKYHFFHHRNNCGNYGAMITIMDDIFHTNAEYHKAKDRNRSHML